jgi:hypothetical protein
MSEAMPLHLTTRQARLLSILMLPATLRAWRDRDGDGQD